MAAYGAVIYHLFIQELRKDLTASEKPCQVGEDLTHLWLIIVYDSDKLNEFTP
jgi:hypothetical protein